VSDETNPATESPAPTVITVPAVDSSVGVIGAAAWAALRAAGVSVSRSNEARCVLEELCHDAVARCQEGPEPAASLNFTVERVTGGVSMHLQDRGLPIASNRSSIKRAKQLAAIGCVDRLEVLGVTPEGPVSDVFVEIPVERVEPDITDTIVDVAGSALRRLGITRRLLDRGDGDDGEAADDSDLTVRLMRPDDVDAYARLAFRCYGYGYKRLAYEPDTMAEQLINGTHLAAVVEHVDGELVGHTAFRRPRSGAPVVEGAAGLVDPNFRRRGLLKRMGLMLFEHIAESNLRGIINEPVMVHTVTQESAHILGYDTGVFLNWSNPRHVAGFDDVDHEGRVSVLCAFVPIGDLPERDVYPPPGVAERVQSVVDHSTLTRRLHDAAAPDSPEPVSALSSVIDPSTAIARIEVTVPGVDLVDRVMELLDDALETGSPVVLLDLPANNPGLGWYAAGTAELGFVFSALLPECAVDGDLIRLQYVAEIPDPTEWKIHLPSTAELVHDIIGDLQSWHDRQHEARRAAVAAWREQTIAGRPDPT